VREGPVSLAPLRREDDLVGTIALIGLPGSGKSTVAPLLAKRLGAPWADLDDRIARASGVPVPELLRRRGEATFRATEEAALGDVLREGEVGSVRNPGGGGGGEAAVQRPGLVLACGGGAVVHERSRALLRERAFVVWLRVTAGTAAARLGEAGALERPLLSGEGALMDRIESLARARAPLYEASAHATVPTDGLTPEQVAARIERAWVGRKEQWDTSGS
jgi:shikimate kinase